MTRILPLRFANDFALFRDEPRAAPPTRGRRKKSKRAEDLFAEQCRTYGLPQPVREYRFAKSIGRRWRFDFAFFSPLDDALDYRVAVEIEGLVVRRINGQMVTTGRHANVAGFREDCRKYSTAAELGWTVLRFEQSMVRSREAIEATMRVLAARGWKQE